MNVSMTDEKTVVLHVSTKPEDVARALGSARTLHSHRPEYRIRIIVNGAAITGVTVGAAELELSAAASIEACEVGMRSHGIVADELQAGVGTVPSAIVALADLQVAGAAYVRI